MSDPDAKELAKQYANIHAAASDLQAKAAQITAFERRVAKLVEAVDEQLKACKKAEEAVLAATQELTDAFADMKPIAEGVQHNADVLKTLAEA